MNMSEIEIQKMFFKPFCNNEEIERIFNVNSTEDYLLKIRADAVADHMRLYRVIRKRMALKGDDWSFTNHFNRGEFEKYISKLDNRNQEKARAITAGYVFNNEVNGCCMRSNYGDLIMVSESLRYFLYFMNLYFMQFDGIKVPETVRQSALLIGIRTMLMTESLDFELDPRGVIPIEIDKTINFYVEKQLEFIIGHEYAHYLLGHLDARNLIQKPMFHLINENKEQNANSSKSYVFYNASQLQEFEADKQSFNLAQFNDEEFNQSISSVFSFFLYLEIYRGVIDTIRPGVNLYQTHPHPIDRLWSLYECFEGRIINKLNKNYLTETIENNKKTIKEIQDHIGFNIELYENYGSVYLAEWRGPVLKDRVDY